jgi:hypothetical protein
MVEGAGRLELAPNRPPLSYSPILWSILGDASPIIATHWALDRLWAA